MNSGDISDVYFALERLRDIFGDRLSEEEYGEVKGMLMNLLAKRED